MTRATNQYVQSSLNRIAAAREIADALRHDEKLHKLAMTAVFVLEDCHETFVRIGNGLEDNHDEHLLK